MSATRALSNRLTRLAAALALAAATVVAGVAAASSVAAAVTPPAYHLQFDNSLANATGNPAAVSMGAGSATYAPGVQGQAISLDHGNYVQLEPDANSLIDYGQSFSVAYWIKINSREGGDPAILGDKNWDSGSNPGWLFHTGGNEIQLNLKDPASARDDVQYTPVALGQWEYVAATFDYTDGTVTAYLNGQVVQTDTRALSNLAGAGPTLLGQAYSNAGLYNSAGFENAFDLDEFTLTQGVLSPSDVSDMYEATKPAAPFTVDAVSVSPQTVRLEKGYTQRFTAVATGEGDPKQDVSWTVAGGSGSTGITDDGTLTIDPNETASTLTVTATSKYADVSDSATVDVVAPRTDGKINFGVISDVHESPTGGENNRRAGLAMKFLSDPALDNQAVVVNGDLTGAATWDEFNTFRNTVNDNLTVPLLANMGNHERNAWSFFERATGDPATQVKVIDGYYFILLSPGSGTFDPVTGRASGPGEDTFAYLHDWTMQQVATAEAASPNTPVFVFQHEPVKGTYYLSDRDGQTDMAGWFTGDPRVVDISGHIHSPNNDPTSIWQDGGYTAVNDAATCSYDLESTMKSGGDNPATAQGSEGIEVSADSSGNVEIKTRDFLANQWVQDWTFNVNQPLPYTAANRVPEAKAPVFDASTQKITISDLDQTSLHVSFPQATEPANNAQDGIHDYQYTITDDSTHTVVQQFKDWSNFWLTPPPATIDEDLSGLTKSTPYTLQICGEDHYGLIGTSCLTSDFTTPAKATKPHTIADYALSFDGSLHNNGQSPEPDMFLVAGSQMRGIQSYQPGHDGQAIQVDPLDVVELDNSPNIDYGQSFTVAFWMNVKIDRDGASQMLGDRNVDSSDNPGYNFVSEKNSDGQLWLHLQIHPANGTFQDLSLTPITDSSWTVAQATDHTGTPISGNEYTATHDNWMHVAATFDNPTNTVTAYVNGQQVAQTTDNLSAGIGSVVGAGKIRSTLLGTSEWNYTEQYGGYNGVDKTNNITFLADDLVLDSTVYTPTQIQAEMADFNNRPATHTVTFDPAGGTPAPPPQTVFDGVTLVEPAPPTKDGYTFDGWFTDPTGTHQWDFDTDGVTTDTTLFAHFTPICTPLTAGQIDVTGSAKVGQSLTVATPAWAAGADTITYQWLRNDTPINGATATSYTATPADLGATLSVQVEAVNACSDVTATSTPATVAKGDFVTATPTIVGKPVISTTLSVNVGTWTPAPTRLSYQWLRNGHPITGATAPTYKLIGTDLGTRISVQITGTRNAYNPATLTSAPTAPITQPRRTSI